MALHSIRKQRIYGIILPLAALFLGLSGCGPSENRVAVRGKVENNGQPVASGSLQFTPEKETEGPSVTAVIKDGRYELTQAEGPAPGKYKVVIMPGNVSLTKGHVESDSGTAGKLDPVAEKIEQPVEFSSGSPNEKNFDIAKKT